MAKPRSLYTLIHSYIRLPVDCVRASCTSSSWWRCHVVSQSLCSHSQFTAGLFAPSRRPAGQKGLDAVSRCECQSLSILHVPVFILAYIISTPSAAITDHRSFFYFFFDAHWKSPPAGYGADGTMNRAGAEGEFLQFCLCLSFPIGIVKDRQMRPGKFQDPESRFAVPPKSKDLGERFILVVLLN